MSSNSEVEGKEQERCAKKLLECSTAVFLQELIYKSTQKKNQVCLTAENNSLTIITIYMQDRGKYYQKWGHQSNFSLNRSLIDSSLEHPPAYRLTAM